MKQIIYYYQFLPDEESGKEKRVDLQIELDTEDPNYPDQIATIEIYCGQDYTFRNIEE